jgi:5'-deoxynucleotidase YfbR-like HD superfamily hydrolase
MTWIQTYTGRQVHVPPRDAGEIGLTDIAHHLSLICRFHGACHQFYSVAEHSVRVLEALEARFGEANLSLNFRRWALLHDAHEAYLGDTPRPIKRDLLRYEGGETAVTADYMEDRFDTVIREAFGISPPTADQVEAIKHADGTLLTTEARDLMAEPPAPRETLPAPLSQRIDETEPPTRAEALFLGRAKALGLDAHDHDPSSVPPPAWQTSRDPEL